MTHLTDQNYWLKEAKKFTSYYTHQAFFSLKKFPQAFLNDRTNALLSYLEPEIKKNPKLLDVGCGHGVHLKMLAQKCQEVVGVDVSQQMLDLAKKELKSLKKQNWKLILADANKLPFPVKSFDIIIAMGLLDYVTSPLNVLNQCANVLKKDGIIVFTIPKKPSLFSPLRTPIGNLIKKVVFGLPPIYQILTKSQVEQLTKKAGFKIERMESIWSTMWIVRARKINSISTS